MGNFTPTHKTRTCNTNNTSLLHSLILTLCLIIATNQSPTSILLLSLSATFHGQLHSILHTTHGDIQISLYSALYREYPYSVHTQSMHLPGLLPINPSRVPVLPPAQQEVTAHITSSPNPSSGPWIRYKVKKGENVREKKIPKELLLNLEPSGESR